jgi:NAD(P)-dependent dehydrogenase (short-subunit alcohol dehydrogenase family)
MTTSRITTAFTAESTAAEVVAGIDLTGRRAIVTGGASGIGFETARALAGAGAEVTLAVRNVDAGTQAAADITASTGSERVSVAPLDLADRDSIRAFVEGWRGPLHLLVNNAGLVVTERRLTAEGWELMFATNHLGHFALTVGLRDALASAGGARVVALSSYAHLESPVEFDDINYERRDFDWNTAYGQSKTAVVLFAVEASRRWGADGITVNAVHPGAIHTGLARHMSAEALGQLSTDVQYVFKTPEQGAATSILVATSPRLDGIGGRYFEDVNEALPGEPGGSSGVAAYALDATAARRLWQLSADAIG